MYPRLRTNNGAFKIGSPSQPYARGSYHPHDNVRSLAVPSLRQERDCSQGCPLIDKQRPILAQGDQYCAGKVKLAPVSQQQARARKEPLRRSNFILDGERWWSFCYSIVNGL